MSSFFYFFLKIFFSSPSRRQITKELSFQKKLTSKPTQSSLLVRQIIEKTTATFLWETVRREISKTRSYLFTSSRLTSGIKDSRTDLEGNRRRRKKRRPAPTRRNESVMKRGVQPACARLSNSFESIRSKGLEFSRKETVISPNATSCETYA